MAEIAGSANIRIGVDTTELKKGLKNAEDETKTGLSKLGSAAKTAGGIFAGIAASAVGAATAAVTSITAKSVELYKDFEQSVGGIETLFKDGADIVLANADTAFERAQISANQYMETATSFSASLIQSLGGDTAKAAQYADRAITDMADNANKMGTSIQSIQNAYQGFAKANYTMLDNLKLGYGGTKSEAERLIQDASKMTAEMEKLGVVVDADSLDFANLVNAISVVQEHMGIAGATAQEATETIQGSINMLKASAQDMIRGLADPNADLGKLFDNLAKSAMAAGKNLGSAILRILPNVADAVAKLVSEVTKKLPDILSTMLPPLVDAIASLANDLIAQLPALVDGFIKIASQIIIQIAQQLPTLMQTITQAIMGIVTVLVQPENLQLIMQAGVQLLLALIQSIPQVVTALYEALPQILTSIIDFLLDPNTYKLIFDATLQLLGAIVAAVPQILGALFEAWKNLFTKLWERMKTVFKTFTSDFGRNLANAAVSAINKVLQFLEDRLNTPVKLLNGAIDAINKIPGVNIGKFSEIKLPRLALMAQGGFVNSATPAVIGEAGPEVVIPLTKDESWAKSIASSLADEFASDELSGGRTINVYMTNQINNELDADEIGRRLITSIRRAI